MNKAQSRAYDLPLRIFHWSFAVLFLLSFSIAKIIDDESALYAYHMLSGLLMTFLVILRIFWGFLGSKNAKFSSFRLKPNDLVIYMTSLFKDKTKRYLGHNPASSYAALFMFIFSLGLSMTGLLMANRINKHFFEEIHELLANGFIVIVILHVMGVILHYGKHRDGLIFSMINGKKEFVEGESEISSDHRFVALLFVILMISFGTFLKVNFSDKTQKLNLFGNQIQLGEKEHQEEAEHE